MKLIEILIKELKQQYEWRCEDSECGGLEVLEGLDMLRCKIEKELDIDNIIELRKYWK